MGKTGSTWYAEQRIAIEGMAVEFGYTYKEAAGIVAALSPRSQWVRNKRTARMVMQARGDKRKLKKLAVFEHCKDKACRIAKGEKPSAVLRGPKVRSFYANLIGYEYAVTLDVWMGQYLGYQDGKLTPKQYAVYADRLRALARQFDVTPADMQARMWVAIRGKGH